MCAHVPMAEIQYEQLTMKMALRSLQTNGPPALPNCASIGRIFRATRQATISATILSILNDFGCLFEMLAQLFDYSAVWLNCEP